MNHTLVHKITSQQSRYRAHLATLTPFNYTVSPAGFASLPPDLYGDIEAFMEYYESGHCALDYDALIANQGREREQHFHQNAASYRIQIAVIPSPNMSEPSVSEEESTASS
jgi:hypothetical protein